MVKNDICLGGVRKQNALFSKNVPQKNAAMPPMTGIGPAINAFDSKKVNINYSSQMMDLRDLFCL